MMSVVVCRRSIAPDSRSSPKESLNGCPHPESVRLEMDETSAWIPLFVASLTALVTSFVSTKAMGQATTPPPRAPDAFPFGELDLSEKPPDDRLTTLNQAVERFLKGNLELRALRLEMPMAQADVETAGQPPQAKFLIEVGVNGIRTSRVQPREMILCHWVDIWVARAVKRVCEMQYEDAVRIRLDNLYTVFADVDEAHRSVSFNESRLRALDALLKVQRTSEETGQSSAADVAPDQNPS